MVKFQSFIKLILRLLLIFELLSLSSDILDFMDGMSDSSNTNNPQNNNPQPNNPEPNNPQPNNPQGDNPQPDNQSEDEREEQLKQSVVNKLEARKEDFELNSRSNMFNNTGKSHDLNVPEKGYVTDS